MRGSGSLLPRAAAAANQCDPQTQITPATPTRILSQSPRLTSHRSQRSLGAPMSRRRASGAAAAAAAAAASPMDEEVSSIISADLPAVAAAAAPMEEEGDLAEETEPSAAAAASAAAPAATSRRRGGGARAAAAAASEPEEDPSEILKRLTSGMLWAPISAAHKEMQKQNLAELKELRGLHEGLKRDAISAIKRAGMAKENEKPCKDTVSRCRKSLEELVEKESYLTAHTEALRIASERVNAGDVPYNVDWAGYMQQLDEEEENKPENKANHEATLAKELKAFDEACWAVHHAGEDADVQALSSNTAQLLKDPFTQDWLFEPVRSLDCGHRYSKAEVSNFLKQKHLAFERSQRRPDDEFVFSQDFRFSCQWAGCRHKISMASLVPDPEAVREVARAKAKIEQQKNQAAGGAGSSAAAAAAPAGARRKRGTVKEEKGTAEAAGTSFDFTQQDEMEDEAAGAAAPAAAAAASSSPGRRASARR